MAQAPTWANPSGGPMTELATNLISYGDNLDILRRYLPGTIRIQAPYR